jgi:nucleolar protein 56
MLKYILFETSIGFALFERLGFEEVGQNLDETQDAMTDFSRFSKLVQILAFQPFPSAAEALQEINLLTEGILSDSLKSFILNNLPKPSKKTKSYQVGISDKNLASTVKHELGFDCVTDETVLELVRALRLHFHKLINADIKSLDIEKAQLGLSHAYSRSKVKFNVNRIDNMIIQAISLVDQIDKDINTFGMRVKEWYSWHFPELSKILPDIQQFAQTVLILKSKSKMIEDISKKQLLEAGIESSVASAILDAAKISIGSDISPLDLMNIERFAKQVISLCEYRRELHEYLRDKMGSVAPNLSALIGDIIGARLIAHAGSLTNLAKYPASTVQILGAEKALFRALKTKGKTPKYGLIYHSSFIAKSATKNKGRISRLLANKCSIASRIDCFSDIPSNEKGLALSVQINERVKHFETV